MRSVVVFFAFYLLVYFSSAHVVKPRTITQACHGDLVAECPTRDVECFAKHQRDAKNSVCRTWLEARAACKEYAQTHNCEKGKERECTRVTPVNDLPPLCGQSDYYKSLFIYIPRSDL